MRNLGYVLIVTGAGLNLVDALTERTAYDTTDEHSLYALGEVVRLGRSRGGIIYGEGGVLKPINDALPINLGVGLMLAGVVVLLWKLVT